MCHLHQFGSISVSFAWMDCCAKNRRLWTFLKLVKNPSKLSFFENWTSFRWNLNTFSILHVGQNTSLTFCCTLLSANKTGNSSWYSSLIGWQSNWKFAGVVTNLSFQKRKSEFFVSRRFYILFYYEKYVLSKWLRSTLPQPNMDTTSEDKSSSYMKPKNSLFDVSASAAALFAIK